MSMIAGIRRPTSGRIRIFGMDAGHNHSRTRIGFMPEVPAFYAGMTALEFVRYNASFYGPDVSSWSDRAGKVLKELGLKDEVSTHVDKLSYGNQRKVSLAVALVHDPDLLLLDEPTTGLDPGSVVMFRDMMKGLKERGKTVFMSSHVLTEVERICDTIGIMVQGELRLKGDLKGILERIGGKGTGGLEKVFLELTGDDDRKRESKAGADEIG